ncbi:hypothetical protein SEEA_C31040 [Salmonella enterica subsp. enterica serovar Abortusequi]
MISAFDIFKIGIGPSSSHTVGPMNAGKCFIDRLIDSGDLPRTTRITVDLYGSLSLTGKGHATDTAIIMGLAGNTPQDVNIDSIPAFIQEVARSSRLSVAGGAHVVDFPVADSILFHAETLARHENGMRITAWNGQAPLLHKTYYSIGGGFIVEEERFGQSHDVEKSVPYDFLITRKYLHLTFCISPCCGTKNKKTSTYTLSENSMESASNTSVILDASAPARRAGMTESEWREAIKFDSTDTGWVIMSIGMAIGAGIVFLPVQVGLMGLWVFLLSSIIGYPAMYLFQRLFINTLAESPECKDYPCVISGYLGKNWGILLGALYFVMLVIWMFVYSTAITNDSASYLHTFGVTEGLLSDSPFYGLVLICILVAISSRGEKLLFKISTGMVLTKLLVVAALGVSMVGMWHLYNIGALPPMALLIKSVWWAV